MKSTVAAAGAIVLALAATTASAGVVITQEVTESNQPAGHKTEQTVMIQGHKQKLVVGEREYITDLDAGKMYYVLAQKKAYMELPFPPISGPERMIARPELVVGLKKTARMDKVAGYDCQDYTNVVPAAQSSLRLTQCVASGAPGAKEFADYQKALADKIKSDGARGRPDRRHPGPVDQRPVRKQDQAVGQNAAGHRGQDGGGDGQNQTVRRHHHGDEYRGERPPGRYLRRAEGLC